MQIQFRHWFTALSIAALIHVSFVLLLYKPSPILTGATGVGLNGIEIALGAAGSAPGSAKTVITTSESTDDVQSHNEVKVEREQNVSPKIIAQAKPEATTEAKLKSRPQLKLKSKPKPNPTLVTQTHVEKTMPEPEQIAATPGNNGKSGTKNKEESGEGDTGNGGGVPGSKRDYFTLLSAWLERHKQYPFPAQRRRQEGTVFLRFVVDRLGNVLSYKIERSSGYNLLDHEIEKMIQRAAPLPAMPDELVQSRLELVVPISFYLR